MMFPFAAFVHGFSAARSRGWAGGGRGRALAAVAARGEIYVTWDFGLVTITGTQNSITISCYIILVV